MKNLMGTRLRKITLDISDEFKDKQGCEVHRNAEDMAKETPKLSN